MNKHRKVHLDVEHKPVAPDPVMVQWIGRRREAKDEFKAAWEQFYASLTPEDIASWHRTEDMARANASWLK